MRDTTRPQCLALLVLAGLAWMSLDLGSLRASLAGMLQPEASAAAPAAAADTEPRPAGHEAVITQECCPAKPEARPPTPRLRVKGLRPGRHVWTLRVPPDANVG